MSPTNTPPPSGLLRIADAARIAGISPRTFRESLSARQIPIAVMQIGKVRHVRAAELQAWLTAAPASAAEDLFA